MRVKCFVLGFVACLCLGSGALVLNEDYRHRLEVWPSAMGIIDKSTGAQRVLLTGDGLSALILRDENGIVRFAVIQTAIDSYVEVNGRQVLRERQQDPGPNPTTEQIRQVLLAHGLIGPTGR